MKIKFEWNTSSLGSSERADLENEIKEKVIIYLKQHARTSDAPIDLDKVKSVTVRMFDEDPPYKVKGSAYGVIEGDTIELIRDIRADGFVSMVIGNKIFLNTKQPSK